MNKYDDTDYQIEREESIEYEEKTADEMFEKLKYKKIHNNDCWLDYRKEWCGRTKIISFEINERYIFIQNENATSMPMNLKELQAINKKCKELGWLQ